jgi:hypothetical protein
MEIGRGIVFHDFDKSGRCIGFDDVFLLEVLIIEDEYTLLEAIEEFLLVEKYIGKKFARR